MDPEENHVSAKISNEYQDCQECIDINEDRQPLQAGSSCSGCILQWNGLIQELATTISKNLVDTTKVKYKKQKKVSFDSSVKEKDLVTDNVSVQAIVSNKKKLLAIKKTTTKYTKPIIPPTKSRHSQQTNRKIMASKKSVNTTITESPKKKSDSEPTKTSVSHFTTGAFMTRRTARTLADPEHGFYPNTHGFIHGQSVEVLNINGYWYPGTLQMMDKGKVKVKYDDWDDQHEWIIMGSRRLRTTSQPNDPTLQPLAKNAANADEIIDVMYFEDRGKSKRKLVQWSICI